MKQNGVELTNYRTLTGGMLQPTAYAAIGGSCTDIGGHVNVNDANEAIIEAEGTPYSVNPNHLGAAVHPYKYNTNETSNPAYWRNYYHEYPGSNGYRGYGGICDDLSGMLNIWAAQFTGMPVVFTEDNWSDHPAIAPDSNACGNYAGCAGTYLVDLYTWLYDHHSYGSASSSPVRLEWFTGINFSARGESFPLGIYNSSGGVQPFNTGTCPNNSTVAGYKNMSDDYRALRNYGACY